MKHIIEKDKKEIKMKLKKAKEELYEISKHIKFDEVIKYWKKQKQIETLERTLDTIRQAENIRSEL